MKCPFCPETCGNKYELVAHWLHRQASDLVGDYAPHQMIKIADLLAEMIAAEGETKTDMIPRSKVEAKIKEIEGYRGKENSNYYGIDQRIYTLKELLNDTKVE